MASQIQEKVNFLQEITAPSIVTSGFPRSQLAQESSVVYPQPWESWRVHDAYHTNLPGTPAADDLGLIGGTLGSASPSLQSEDLKAAGLTDKYARAVFQLPAEYSSGATINLRASAGMLTTIADTLAELHFEVFKSNRAAGVGSDLVTTPATDVNSTTIQDYLFGVTPTGLVAGDILDLRAHFQVNDAATGTEVKAILGAVEWLLNIRG